VQGYLTIGATVAGLALLSGCATATGIHNVAATAPATHSASKTRTKTKAKKSTTAKQDLASTVALPVENDGSHVSVAVDDLSTGMTASYNGTDNEFVTASIVKADILSTLLYQSQQSGQALNEDEQELATTMIENSDNDSATALFQDIGTTSGLDAANKVFGLTGTSANSAWGDTTTTTDDQIKLLRQIFTSDSVLSASSREYIQDLMSQVEADQRWGVPAAADSGTDYYVKNGWLPRSATNLWEINSIGEIIHDGQRMLIAVLSADNESEDSGIDLVQQIATDAANAMAKAGKS
jgi:beta-lactamase class A